MCSNSHITKYERGTPKSSFVSSRRTCQTMKVFKNYVKMNAEVLLEVSTHPERYIFQSPIRETFDPHSTAVTSNMQSSVLHYFLPASL